MDFDKSKVYTVMTADKVKIGSKGYYADCPKVLEERVNSDNKAYYNTLVEIAPTSEVYRFKPGASFSSEYALFYLVEEPEKKKLQPYRDTDEMIEHFNNHFNILPLNHRPPVMWVKSKTGDRTYLITRFTKDTVTLCYEENVFTFRLDTLAKDFTWFDGSPCGVKEEE